MESGHFVTALQHTPATTVLKRAREVREISKNLVNVAQGWPNGQSFLKSINVPLAQHLQQKSNSIRASNSPGDFSLNFTPVARGADKMFTYESQLHKAPTIHIMSDQVSAAKPEVAAKSKGFEDTKSREEVSAEVFRPKAEKIMQRMAEAAIKAERQRIKEETEKDHLEKVVAEVEKLHDKLDESTTALAHLKEGIIGQDHTTQLEKKRQEVLLQSRLLESVRANENLTVKLRSAKEKIRQMQLKIDEQKTAFFEARRANESMAWKNKSEHSKKEQHLISRNERLAQELHNTRQQFRTFLRVVQSRASNSNSAKSASIASAAKYAESVSASWQFTDSL